MHDAIVACGMCVSCLLADRCAGVHDDVGVFSHGVVGVFSHGDVDEHGVVAACCARGATILEVVFKEVCFNIISFFHSRLISASCDCVACARPNIPIVLVVPAVFSHAAALSFGAIHTVPSHASVPSYVTVSVSVVVPAVPNARASMILSRISEKYSEF